MGGFANNAPIVTDGLVFYVDAGNSNSYPGSGGTWSDLVGGNNGSFNNMDDINNPSNNYNSGNGGSIVFDGTNDSVIVSNISTNDFSGEATLLCWLACNSNAPSTNQTGIFGWGSHIYRSHYPWTNGLAYFDTFRNARVDSISLSSLDKTIPHLLAITTKSGGNWNLYQNTTLVKTTTAESAIVWDNATIGADGNEGYRFQGKFFAFSIYNRELSLAEITQNYNALKNRFI